MSNGAAIDRFRRFAGRLGRSRWLSGLAALAMGSSMLGAIAPAAAAETDYGVEQWWGLVWVLSAAGDRVPITHRQPLRSWDWLQISGQRGWVRIRCPDGKPAQLFATANQPRMIATLCNPTGLQAIGSVTRLAQADLLAAAAGQLSPQTYIDPERSRVSWPPAADAVRYRVRLTDAGDGSLAWVTETSKTHAVYGGGPLVPGRMYQLSVVAIDAQDQNREHYRLNRINPLPPKLVHRWQIDTQDLQQYPLAPADRRWLMADVASAIATDRDRLPPELWWEVLAQLEPEAHHNQNPALHLRLATAYLHLGRWQEARSAAERAIAIAGNQDSFDRAEALVMRAQVTRMLQRCPEAIADLRVAQRIYRAIGLPAEADTIDLALNNVTLRPCTALPQSPTPSTP